MRLRQGMHQHDANGKSNVDRAVLVDRMRCKDGGPPLTVTDELTRAGNSDAFGGRVSTCSAATVSFWLVITVTRSLPKL